MPMLFRFSLIGLLLLFAVMPARAQVADDGLQRAYAAIEPRIRAEYEFYLRGIAQQMLASGAPVSKMEPFQRRLKLLTYNRAVLIANCIADAERDRPRTETPVPWEQNMVLTTCVDEKAKLVQRFSQLASYADFFFPERIEQCGEQARLTEREKELQPYAFLMLDQPKFYDFERYNDCMMKQRQ